MNEKDTMHYMTTVSGHRILDPDNPKPEDIHIKDIAVGLSHTPRFAGQSELVINVAQHSILVSRLSPDKYCLEGLLHDGSEAYLGDLAHPIKRLLPDYKLLERKWMHAIRLRYDLSVTPSKEVKEADRMVQAIEARHLNIYGWREWGLPDISDYTMHHSYQIMDADTARKEFLRIFRALTK